MDVGALYAAPLTEFIRARKALADRLRAEGRIAEAREVLARRKPTKVTWGIDQLARRAPDQLARFVASGERLIDAQQAVLEGGDTAELRASAVEHRRLLGELVSSALAALSEAGLEAGPDEQRRTSATLQAASLAAPPVRRALRAGTLEGELALESGFGLGDVTVTPRGRRGVPARPRGGRVEERTPAPTEGARPRRRSVERARGRTTADAANGRGAEAESRSRAEKSPRAPRAKDADARARAQEAEAREAEARHRAEEAGAREAEAREAEAREAEARRRAEDAEARRREEAETRRRVERERRRHARERARLATELARLERRAERAEEAAREAAAAAARARSRVDEVARLLARFERGERDGVKTRGGARG